MNTVMMKKITGFVAALACIVSLHAQVYNDAAIAYNKGVATFTTDVDSAIFYFEDCLRICDVLGDTAIGIKMQASQVLPNLYFQKAYNLLTTDKNIDGALKASKKTMEVAKKYDDATTIDKTEKLMIQAYATMGSTYFSNNEPEKAISAFDSVLAINPDHLTALYNKSLTYKKMNNPDKYGEAIDIYLEKLKAAGETAKAEQASRSALEYFRGLASKANRDNKLTEAIELLNTACKYSEDKDVYYYYAAVYNKQKKYADAAINAQKGLDMETGTPEDKAKFYYELGVAQAGKGDTANACNSFKNSMYGTFLEASKGQRTNLKCN